nr:hypothetical protein [uncultured Prevotella sp.]
MEFLNEYSGLFSLLAVVTSVVAIVVSVMIYRKQKKDHLQDLQDEYEAIESNSKFPMSIAEREYFIHESCLQKKLRRK